MKYFIYILIVLILALIIYNFISFREGLEQCPAGQTNATVQDEQGCEAVNSQVNEKSRTKLKAKFQEVKKSFTQITKLIQDNSKQIMKNKKAAQNMQNVADGKDNDNTDACAKYPEAC